MSPDAVRTSIVLTHSTDQTWRELRFNFVSSHSFFFLTIHLQRHPLSSTMRPPFLLRLLLLVSFLRTFSNAADACHSTISTKDARSTSVGTGEAGSSCVRHPSRGSSSSKCGFQFQMSANLFQKQQLQHHPSKSTNNQKMSLSRTLLSWCSAIKYTVIGILLFLLLQNIGKGSLICSCSKGEWAR